MNDHVVFEYLYRDANNFKAFGEIFLSGKINESYLSQIRSYLLSEEHFVAEQVDVPVLYSELWKYSNGPTIADHAFHEYINIRPVSDAVIDPSTVWGTTEKFLELFRNANHDWDCSVSVHANI